MFGSERKASNRRILTALNKALDELAEFTVDMKIDAAFAKRIEGSSTLSQDQETRDRIVRASAYVLIAKENAMLAAGKRPFFSLRPLYPPLDSDDPEAVAFFLDCVRRFLFSQS